MHLQIKSKKSKVVAFSLTTSEKKGKGKKRRVKNDVGKSMLLSNSQRFNYDLGLRYMDNKIKLIK